MEALYWDSNAFLAWLQEEPVSVDLCRATIERAEAGEVLIVTSALTIAEVLWLKNHPKVPEARAELVRGFFRRSYIRVRNVTRLIAENSQSLVWDHSIRPKDAIHVATALDAGLSVMETFDGPLLDKSGTVGDPLLLIRKPQPPRQQSLDLRVTTRPLDL